MAAARPNEGHGQRYVGRGRRPPMINEGGVTVSALNSEVATSPRGPTVAQGNPSFPPPSYQCTHVKWAAPADSSRHARLPTP